MAESFLDKTGLTYFWGKIKTYVTNAVKVTGVKGTAESSYRTGNVNITADNVHAITKNQNGNTLLLKRPSYTQGVPDITVQGTVNTLRANRLAFLPADQIIIEKTIDGGQTWTDAGISDADKVKLFSEVRPNIPLPKIDGLKNALCGIRVTITAMKYAVPAGTTETQKYNYWNSNYIVSAERYCQLKEMYFWVSVAGGYIDVKVERAKGSSADTWDVAFNSTDYKMSGYSGNDYISFTQGVFGGGITQINQYWNYRLTFMTDPVWTQTGNYPTYTQTISEIRGYGDAYWTKGNEYMANDKMYTHDYLKNVTFPAKVTASDGFSGNLTGMVNGHSINFDLSGKNLDSDFKTKFRTETKGDTASGDYISTIRTDTANIDSAPQYAAGLAFGRSDTHGYILPSYATANPSFYVGGGNANKLNWTADLMDGVKSITRSGTTFTVTRLDGTTFTFDQQDTTYSQANSNTTGITVSDHSSTTIYGVQSSTTSVTGVSGSVTGSHVKSGGNGTAPTLGTAISVPNVTDVGSGSFTSGSFNGGSGSFTATVTNHIMSFSHSHTAATHGADSHTHTAPTLGTAISVPNVTSVGSASNWVFEDVTVPKAATSATTVPIKNSSTTTVITSKTHTVNDSGHTHTLS